MSKCSLFFGKTCTKSNDIGIYPTGGLKFIIMENLIKLYHQREIQLLVLVSFTLQMFLFFTGSLRARSTNPFLRFSIWIAYLGADFTAVYGLGYLSRHDDIQREMSGGTQPLAFFWASFLLIHLGGQDTITAFSMADNNLWLRHLLNLAVQVVLAAYVFWKSPARHSAELLVSGFLVFIAGVIKYVERTLSLKYGRFKSLESSTGDHYKKRLPELNDSDHDYSKIVLDALSSMLNVHNVFAARNPFVNGPDSNSRPVIARDMVQGNKRLLRVVELELVMMYDDLYTKALVLRTMGGMIIRCTSYACSLVAFALFLTCDKGRYNGADVAITYSLFIGGFFLDLCAMFIFITSPWTWAWLKVQKFDWLAGLSWFLFSSDIGWPEKRPRWSNSIGQYNLLSWVSGEDQPRSCKQRVMNLVRRLVSLVGVGKENLFWMSKMLDTEYVEADEKTMEFVIKGISRLSDESAEEEQWQNLGPLLKKIRIYYVADIGCAIVVMHIFTEVYLNAVKAGEGGGDVVIINDMVEVCRKLSNYMMHLFVNHPSMLPLNASSEATVVEFAKSRKELFRIQEGSKLTLEDLYKIIQHHREDVPMQGTMEELYKIILDEDVKPSTDALEEMAAMWLRLLIFAAGRSNGKVHAAELARGGELITFAWLLMAREGLGESERKRVRMTSTISSTDSAGAAADLKEAYAFFYPD